MLQKYISPPVKIASVAVLGGVVSLHINSATELLPTLLASVGLFVLVYAVASVLLEVAPKEVGGW
jgi:hypothetical protein